jgi:glyoxylase-like metal-dependent hydrolase (beta-lactamase superfamily II)
MAEPVDALRYPLDAKPGTGEVVEIAPGVCWLRLPLPFMLNHINVWLLQEAEGWALVDTGLYTHTTREVWNQVLARHLGGAPLTRVLVTHLHPDHVGCAGWLAQRHGCEFWMTREEYLLCRVLVADTGKPAPPVALSFYRAAGFEEEQLDRYAEHFGAFGTVVAPLPLSYRRLHDGARVRIGDQGWEVLVGRGHSPEHACLLNRELNLLIAGDQLLPTISSNVSVYPTEPNANPLEGWFASIERLERELPAGVLVLPAHGKPFLGARHRLRELAREHEAGLEKLRTLCREPRRAVDVFPALFKSPITDRNLIMAAGESISHLNYLIERGEMTAERDGGGVDWYRMLA